MAGLEALPNSPLHPLDPSMFKNPVSETGLPGAAAALADAFRKGEISAEDIIERHGELAQQKRKAELQSISEFNSPEAIEARRQDVLEKHGELAQQKKKLELQAIQEATSPEAVAARKRAANVASQDLDLHEATTIYGKDAIESFYKYAPLTPGYDGPPKTNDGKIDWQTVAREGANLSAQADAKAKAALRATVHKTLSAEESGVGYQQDVNVFGEPLDPKTQGKYSEEANKNFQFKYIKPGGLVSAPQQQEDKFPHIDYSDTYPIEEVTPKTEIPEAEKADDMKRRAQLLNAKWITQEQANTLSADEVKQLAARMGQPQAQAQIPASDLVTPKTTPTVQAKPTVTIGEYVPGKGRVSKIPVEKPVKGAETPATLETLQQQTSDLTETLGDIQHARTLVTEKNVGPLLGSTPAVIGNKVAAAFGFHKGEYDSQRELEILISHKILEGARQMKGNLSDKDVKFLKDSVPKLSDSPEVWKKFLNLWERKTNEALQVVNSRLKNAGATGFAAPEAETGAPATTPSTGAVPDSEIKVINGRKVQHYSDGTYRTVE